MKLTDLTSSFWSRPRKKTRSLFLAFLITSSMSYGTETVDLELSLVIDVSGSVDDQEYTLMMQGYAEAFRSETFQVLAFRGDAGAIAVNVIHFSGSAREMITWTKLADRASANQFANQLENLTRTLPDNNGTDISEAIDLSFNGFAENGFESEEQVISVAGDGEDNRVPTPSGSRDNAIASGIETIHGIVIGDAVGGPVETHYRDEVLGGATPLLCTAVDFVEFGDAILFKLNSVVRLGSGDCPVLPTTLRFSEEIYNLEAGQALSGQVIIDPVPVGGLYSQGTEIYLRDSTGTMVGFVRPTPSATLSFNGLQPAPSRIAEEQGVGALKGSADFFNPIRPTEFRSSIASFNVEALPPGEYDLSLGIWNDLGTTEAVFVSGCCEVLDPLMTLGSSRVIVAASIPELTQTGPITVEAQTGLLTQKLTFRNNGGNVIGQFRIYVEDLPADVTLMGLSGIEDGIPYIDVFAEIAPGQSIDVVLEYQRTSRDTGFLPSFRLENSAGGPPPPDPGGVLAVDLRLVEVSGKGVIVEFQTEVGESYGLEYSDGLSGWKVSSARIEGNGERFQWLDSGPPKTETFPTNQRFYRVVEK